MYFLYAEVLKEEGEYKKAEENFRKYLELVPDLTTSAYLRSQRRFIARRGFPIMFVSLSPFLVLNLFLKGNIILYLYTFDDFFPVVF